MDALQASDSGVLGMHVCRCLNISNYCLRGTKFSRTCSNGHVIPALLPPSYLMWTLANSSTQAPTRALICWVHSMPFCARRFLSYPHWRSGRRQFFYVSYSTIPTSSSTTKAKSWAACPCSCSLCNGRRPLRTHSANVVRPAPPTCKACPTPAGFEVLAIARAPG